MSETTELRTCPECWGHPVGEKCAPYPEDTAHDAAIWPGMWR